MDVDEVRQLRSFNRTVTERIGALDDHYLARGRPLGASRVLWEIGPNGADVRTLRARLALDSGYLSRLLRSLERDGLVTVGPLESDRRVRVARRTPAGEAEVAEIDRLSDGLASSLLEPLDDRQRRATGRRRGHRRASVYRWHGRDRARRSVQRRRAVLRGFVLRRARRAHGHGLRPCPQPLRRHRRVRRAGGDGAAGAVAR